MESAFLFANATRPILALLAAHLLADFPLQPQSWVKAKYERAWKTPFLYLHAILAGLAAWLCVQQWRAWWVFVVVALGHIVFDGWKARRRDHGLGAFLADQAAHVAIVLALAILLVRGGAVKIWPGDSVWVLGNAALLVWWFEGAVMAKATARWRASLKGTSRGLIDAGMWIGRLERALVLLFILAGHYEGIGFLIAAKSVFRFEVTKSRHRCEAEYVLIGTLGSFLLATLTGIGARALR